MLESSLPAIPHKIAKYLYIFLLFVKACTECGQMVNMIMMGVPWRGRTPRAMCPENLILLWNITLLVVVTMSLLINEFYENSKGASSPSLGNVIDTIIATDLFQCIADGSD